MSVGGEAGATRSGRMFAHPPTSSSINQTQPLPLPQVQHTQPTPQTTRRNKLQAKKTVMISSRRWIHDNNRTTHPLIVFINQNRAKEDGWMSSLLATGNMKKKWHRRNAVTCLSNTASSSTYHVNMAVSEDDWSEKGFEFKRKENKNKGKTMFNCEQRREQTFTAFNVYKHERARHYRNSPDRLSVDKLKKDFFLLSDDNREAYEDIAKTHCSQAWFLHLELVDLSKHTRGKQSYKTMARDLGDIVYENTIQMHLQSFESFSTRKIVSYLTLMFKQRRNVLTGQKNSVFWECAKYVKPETVLILAHGNEKWWWSIVTQCGDKNLPEFGVEAVDYYAQHKSHVHKCMYHTTTGIVVNKNNITKGGKALMIAIVRIGQMEQCKKDTYKRVYDDEGNYTMPKLPEN
eukprot:6748045-Ditylum_brightwellii.AAC.1